MRPQIRDFLQQRLALSSLEMGRLSWRWAGWLWVHADDVRLRTRDGLLRYGKGDVAVRLPLWPMLLGRIAPDRIELDGGALELNLPQPLPPASAAGRLPDVALVLNDVALSWRVGETRGVWPRVRFSLDDGRLALEAAGLRLNGRLDADGLPARLTLEARGLDWLPRAWRAHVRGAGPCVASLARQETRRWRFSLGLRAGEGRSKAGNEGARIVLAGFPAIPFDELAARGEIVLDDAGALSGVRLHRAAWRQGESAIDAHGAWRAGRLRLQASAPRLALRHVWSWLAPLEDAPAWRDWLSRMRAGEGRNIEASLDLAWPLPGWPDAAALDAMRWKVTGEVHGAEIALGTGGEALTDLEAALEVSDAGLQARIRHARLPARMGEAKGRMRMDWRSLLMHIEGEARADMARVLARLGPPQARQWRWQASAATGSFSLLWHPEEETPRKASAVIRPDGVWRVRVNGMALALADGEVGWDAARGFTMRNMRVEGRRLHGRVSLAASERKAAGGKGAKGAQEGAWRLTALDARGSGDFASLAAHFQLPVAGASGMLAARIVLDSHWHGALDLTDSGWNNLLGGGKRIGDGCVIAFSGRARTDDIVRLDDVRGACKAFAVRGSARLSNEGLRVSLDRLETRHFRGALTITGPLAAGAPWEMDVRADYLDRRAIPTGWGKVAAADDKPWALRARIQRFVWDDAELSGVLLNIASRKDSVGMLEAARIHAGDLNVTDAAAMFALRGDGVIDLRRLRARMEKQALEMSATLTPRAGGGMDWRGFALLEGDFGHLMKRAGLSSRFLGGRAHVLFAGRGVALRDQPWWKDLQGRVRLRVDEGRVLEGGPLTKLLAITSLADLPRLLLGMRKDLSGPGLMFDRLQMEAIMRGHTVAVRNLALRSSAFDMAGQGEVRLDARTIDMKMVVHPLQNLDAILAKIPLLRDLLGGRAHSLYRKVYWMHGPVEDAKVEEISPEKAGLASGGLVETLLGLPARWFGGPPAGQPGRAAGGGG